MEKEKKPQIVAIINDTTVIINLGSREGIKEHDKFDILDDDIITLRDPDTKEILGRFSQSKEKIFVREVHKKFSICVSQYKTINSPLINSLMRPVNPLLRDVNNDEEKIIGRKLNIDSKEENNFLKKYNHKKVHIGDRVKLIKK